MLLGLQSTGRVGLAFRGRRERRGTGWRRMARHDHAKRWISWALPACCRWAVAASRAVYAGARWMLLALGWLGGLRAERAVIKHRWELEARGRLAWVEQAASTSWPLTGAGRLGRRERLVRMGEGRKCGGQCSTRSLSAARRRPAPVKGDAAHPGGAQVVRGLATALAVPCGGEVGWVYVGLWSAVDARKRRRRGLPTRRSATAESLYLTLIRTSHTCTRPGVGLGAYE
jgi:hypothetical protein